MKEHLITTENNSVHHAKLFSVYFYFFNADLTSNITNIALNNLINYLVANLPRFVRGIVQNSYIHGACGQTVGHFK